MTEASGMALVLEVADRLIRSWWTAVAGICLGLAGALIALHFMPRTYVAATKILVVPPKIPQEFVKSTVNDDFAVRIAALKDAVLSRNYMTKLIDKLYGGVHSEAAIERMIADVGSRLDVKMDMYNQSGQRAGMFSLLFRDDNPKRAAAVVNELSDMYIAENTRYRSGRAEEATHMIEQLAADVRKQLEAKERAVAEFKSRHLYDLPERSEANLGLLQSRQRDLDANQKALQTAQDRLQLVQSQLQGASAGAPTAASAANAAYEARLADLQRELTVLRSRYFDDHPEVKAKEREIQEFITAGPAAMPKGMVPTTSAPPPAALSPLEQEAQTLAREVERYRNDQTKIRNDIAVYTARLEAAPQVQLQLDEITKGFEALQKQYQDYQGKVQSAKGAETIEDAQKGEQFEVIERAIPPVFPVAPKPAIILAAGVVFGLLAFTGPLLVLGFLRPTVQSEEGLRAFASVPLLVSIPRIDTDAAKRQAVRDRVRNVGLSALSAGVLAIVVIVEYVR